MLNADDRFRGLIARGRASSRSRSTCRTPIARDRRRFDTGRTSRCACRRRAGQCVAALAGRTWRTLAPGRGASGGRGAEHRPGLERAAPSAAACARWRARGALVSTIATTPPGLRARGARLPRARGGTRIFVLGDMAELGPTARDLHRDRRIRAARRPAVTTARHKPATRSAREPGCGHRRGGRRRGCRERRDVLVKAASGPHRLVRPGGGRDALGH